MREKEDVIGVVFGRLTVVSEINTKGGRRRVLCKCTCGKTKEVLLGHLRSNKIVSCGCYRLERIRESNSKTATRHGMYGTRPYRIWAGIKHRCNDTSDISYNGCGINYDPRWESFEMFWEDMKEGYDDTLTIDRIDPNGNYCKGNCRWADKSTQSFNKRSINKCQSGRTGVFLKRGKWCATINKNKRNYFLGSYTDKNLAIKAREEAEIKFYGKVLGEKHGV